MQFVGALQELVVAVVEEEVLEQQQLVRFGLFANVVAGLPGEVKVQDGIVFGLQSLLDSGYALSRRYSMATGSLAIIKNRI